MVFFNCSFFVSLLYNLKLSFAWLCHLKTFNNGLTSIKLKKMKENFKTNLVIFITSILTSVLLAYVLDYIDNFPNTVLYGYLQILISLFLLISVIATFKTVIYFIFLIISIIE